MRLRRASAFAIGVALLASGVLGAQGQPKDTSRTVAGGGISVPGWTGKIDANEEKAGQVLNNAKLAQQGNVLQVTTGPAVTYWKGPNAGRRITARWGFSFRACCPWCGI